MHELSIVMEVVKHVERLAVENRLTVIDTLVLQVGELSSMIPHYIEAVYPAAVEGTALKDTKLVIEVIPGNGRCTACSHIFNLKEHRRICPKCSHEHWEILSGKEFMIKELIAY